MTTNTYREGDSQICISAALKTRYLMEMVGIGWKGISLITYSSGIKAFEIIWNI